MRVGNYDVLWARQTLIRVNLSIEVKERVGAPS